ncbi:MAG: hypothetical protein ACRDU8_03740, partial [Egibacteraceae bacterium]
DWNGGGSARNARRLLAPDRAGGFLTTADLAELARRAGAPWRPSDVRSRLRHLVETLLDTDRLALLDEVFGPVVSAWEQHWRQARDTQPGASRIFERWRLRAAATRSWLNNLADQRADTDPPVLCVPDDHRLATALLRLSAAGVVVSVDPAPPAVRAAADALVRIQPGTSEHWEGQPPQDWTDVANRLRP